MPAILPPIATAVSNSTTLALELIEHVFNAPTAPVGGWASIIGIVTAIIGNVLISFALNTQRYAHVRLRRDGKEAAERSSQNGHGHGKAYETIQKEIADERSKINSKAKDETIPDEVEELEPATEVDALIPHVREASPASSIASKAQPQDEKASEGSAQKSYLRSPYWWLGMVLMIVGEAGNFLAYGFAPASIVSPLGVVALVVNCMIAPIMLKERFRWRDAFGVVVAVGGTVTVVLSAEGSNPKLGPNDILALLKRWEFLTYFGITTTAIIVLAFLSNKYGDRTIVIDIGLVGLFGGYTALSTKGVASLLSYRLFLVVTYPLSYLLVVVLVFTAVMQIKYINRALQHFNSTQVIPTQFVMFTIFVVVGSAILYRDFERTTPKKIGQFLGGVALTFLGVWFITGGRSDESDDSTDAAAEEGRIALIDDEATESEDNTLRPSARPTSTTPPSKAQPHNNKNRPLPLTPAKSSTDIKSYIASAQIQPKTAAAAPKTPQQTRPFNRTTSTPLFRASYTLIQPPATPSTNSQDPSHPLLHRTQTPPTSPSPRRTTHQTRPGALSSRRPVSDLSPGTLSPTRTHNPHINIDSRTGNFDASASTGTPAGTRNQLSSRSASLVGRMLSLNLQVGPLVGPLSGSLSAVVAGDLRKGSYRGGAGAAEGDSAAMVSPRKGAAAGGGRGSYRGVRRASSRPSAVDGVFEDEENDIRGCGTSAGGGGGGKSDTGRIATSGAAVGMFKRSGLVRSESEAMEEEEEEEAQRTVGDGGKGKQNV